MRFEPAQLSQLNPPSSQSGGLIRWLIASAIVVVVFLVTPLLAKMVSKRLGHPDRSEKQRSMAAPASRFFSTLIITVGLLAAIGVVSPSSLAPFPTQIIQFVPRLLIAILLMLVGSTLATLAANIVGMAATRSTGKPQPAVTRLVRLVVLIFVGLLAIGQLGVNTNLLDTITQAVLFGFMAMVALLGALGGRDLASDVSSGRYMKRIVNPGDHVESGSTAGTVKAVHAATVELQIDDRTTVHVPHHLLMQQPLRVRTADPSPTHASTTDPDPA
jgi:preprotein translocase subunit YajC